MRADSDEFNKWLSVAIQSCCESWRSSILQEIEIPSYCFFLFSSVLSAWIQQKYHKVQAKGCSDWFVLMFHANNKNCVM